MAELELDLQLALKDSAGVPDQAAFSRWALAAMGGLAGPQQMTIRIVDEAESAALNEAYRHKQGPTNVLSFAAEVPAEVDEPLLGDLVICAPVVAREAAEQNKSDVAHWAHMVVHGCLHLQGYDHLEEQQAREMEGLETRIMAELGFADPYAEEC